ncbi:hypothetical protein [Chamaesiphon sp. OTE_75_metabat_556]|uniref:hypothetical protein n=1 Tax=Chamaesiphon sp. OTE_75_metabat_556 TaxID=2964692 RepID=UPI00286D3350|nr:hypothetical protein [Chamaesiphon sp. OTE_75_metabat_556]
MLKREISFLHKLANFVGKQQPLRRFAISFGAILLLLLLFLPITAVETQAKSKKLIEYGWDAPPPNFFRQQIREMEQRPFDGVILKLNAGKEVFKKTAYPTSAFTQDRRDLAATTSTKLTDNFVVMWSGMDAGWDWFDDRDWAAAEKNIYNFAKTAKAGRFKGIAFDSEPYTTTSPWKYYQQPQQQQKTFDQYQQQVRQRGAQFVRVVQSAQPGTQVLAFGLLSWLKDLWATPIEATKLQQQLARHDYGLWPAFVNGMLDAAQPSTTIVEGHEWAYYFYKTAWFDATRDAIFNRARRLFVAPKNQRKYDRQVKLGQAVYLDLVLDALPGGVKDPRTGKTTQHFLSPADRFRLLEHNVYHSLRTSDRYTWLYSESADWWQNQIPPSAEATIRRAQAKIRRGQPLGFDLDSAVDKAVKQCQAVSENC